MTKNTHNADVINYNRVYYQIIKTMARRLHLWAGFLGVMHFVGGTKIACHWIQTFSFPDEALRLSSSSPNWCSPSPPILPILSSLILPFLQFSPSYFHWCSPPPPILSIYSSLVLLPTLPTPHLHSPHPSSSPHWCSCLTLPTYLFYSCSPSPSPSPLLSSPLLPTDPPTSH